MTRQRTTNGNRELARAGLWRRAGSRASIASLRVDTVSTMREDGTIDMSQRARLGMAVDVMRLEQLYWAAVDGRRSV